MRIQHNIAAMNSYRNYTNNTGALAKNLEKLSSGYKINRAGDDAAGLAISEKMRAQISGLKQAQSNVKDGISLVKTAEGALQEVQDMLNRMTTLATQSANGTYDNEVDRANLQKEVESLKSEIDRIADSSNFNGTKLLDGSLGGRAVSITATANGIQHISVNGGGTGAVPELTATLTTAGKLSLAHSTAVSGVTWEIDGAANKTITEGGTYTFKAKVTDTTAKADMAKLYEGMTVTITVADKTSAGLFADQSAGLAFDPADASQGLELQIGDTADSYNKLKVEVGDMHTDGILNVAGVNISSQQGASDAIKVIKTAINTVSSTRGDLGAIQNRLEHTTKNLQVMTENIQDAESTIRDVDIADEMTSYTKNNILLQSAQAMLAQANQMPQGVLQLLQ